MQLSEGVGVDDEVMYVCNFVVIRVNGVMGCECECNCEYRSENTIVMMCGDIGVNMYVC